MYDPGEWTSLRKADMARYFYENVKDGCVYILDKKSSDFDDHGLYNRTASGFYSEKEAYGPLKTMTKEEVLAHESEWYSNDEYGWICDDPYFVWYYPKQEKKEEPQEDKSCGTSLADLLKKSGF